MGPPPFEADISLFRNYTWTLNILTGRIHWLTYYVLFLLNQLRGGKGIMFPARKIAVSILSVLFLSLYIAGAAYAQDVMGCVDPQKIMFQHPKFEQIQKQVRDVTNKKQEEAKVAIDKETDDKKKAQIFQNKRTEAANEERKLMEPLFKDINLAIRTVANAKKITVVVDKGAVFFGGTDITDDVIADLKKKK